MIVYHTVKRRIVRSVKRVDRFIGYANTFGDEGPSLAVSMPDGYEVTISFRDLAHLVRKADELANTNLGNVNLKNWREYDA